jgi:hypothetical protein
MFDRFKYIVPLDTEFDYGGHDSLEAANRSGERQRHTCLVAKELRFGKTWRLYRGGFPAKCPFPIGADALIVFYYGSAELGTFLDVGWSMPVNVLDLFIEFRLLTNGLKTIAGNSLVGALVHFGLDHVDALEKTELRLDILRGGASSAARKKKHLDYCAGDVEALVRVTLYFTVGCTLF